MMHDESSSQDMVSISIGGADPSGRDYFENRRRRQAKENSDMLGILESMGDDDSYLENTLASLEYSAATSQGAFKDIVDKTAPYSNNRWKPWLRNRSLKAQRFFKKLFERLRVVLQNYGPYILILLVYLAIRITWKSATSTSMDLTFSDTEKITLNTYRDSYLNQLQPDVGQSSSQKVIPTQSGRHSHIPVYNEMPEYPPLHKSKYQIEETHDDDLMALPPTQVVTQETNGAWWNDFQERVKKLREISERGRAAINPSGNNSS